MMRRRPRSCDGSLPFRCEALLPGGPLEDLSVMHQPIAQPGWRMSRDGEVHTCPPCTARYDRGEHLRRTATL